ncbi:tRNA-2-methylthio-N(6)-dimethylallyladenosine synthase [Candidatus Norongarragalina meridionalis]|nr:tRNA-2-methylthio-N(6)-dimethylallyladenosine synthase [Candidatus Norongarragalina meridionalis]
MRVLTYGCSFNRADSDAMAAALGKTKADVVVYNTCCVKDATEQKILNALRREKNPVVVTGCLAEAEPGKILRARPDASLVGISQQYRIADAVKSAARGKPVRWLGKGKRKLEAFCDGAFARIRICEGCLGACSFCETRIARGGLRSYGVREIRLAAERCVRNGAKELQLCAQDDGAYGKDIGASLPELTAELNKVPGDFRVRIGMLNPEHALRVLSAFSPPKVYKFLHIPVQSGSDTVLRKMRRPYTVAAFRRTIASYRKKYPRITIVTDVIVGFPGETEADFKKTMDLLREIRFDIVNISKYSARPGTKAALLPQVPNFVIKKRSEEASAFCRAMSEEKNREWIGWEGDALFLDKLKDGTVGGRNDSYKSIAIKGAKIGETRRVKVVGATHACLLATSREVAAPRRTC